MYLLLLFFFSTYQNGAPEEQKYKILVLSSFFDASAPLGREITINLIRHLLVGYKLHEPLIQQLLKKSVIYLLPMSHHFDEIFESYNSKYVSYTHKHTHTHIYL